MKVLRDSLAVLGIKATKNLVIYLSTKTMSANYKSDTFKKYLNRFPIYAALVEQNVALETKLKPQADECFLAALLHSIGMNIMALQKQGHYSDMIDACEKNKWELSKLEKQSYGSTHTTLGKRAAEAWKLPEIFKRLMEISPATEYTNLLDPLEKSTYIASVVASTPSCFAAVRTVKRSTQSAGSASTARAPAAATASSTGCARRSAPNN